MKRVVQESTAFVCAWCGVALTEYHHIEEFSSGGPSTPENLILLCPSCHAQVTTGTIGPAEVALRKSEVAGRVSRGSGNLNVPASDLDFRIGNIGALNCEGILQVNADPPLISVRRQGARLLLSFHYFDEEGRLMAWMSDNRWWVDDRTGLEFTFTNDSLEVGVKGAAPALAVRITDRFVGLSGVFWVRGTRFEFSDQLGLRLPTGGVIANFSVDMAKVRPNPLVRVLVTDWWGPKGYTWVHIASAIIVPFGIRFQAGEWVGSTLTKNPLTGEPLNFPGPGQFGP